MSQQIFNGSSNNNDILRAAMTNGHMLETSHKDFGVDEIRRYVSRALFAQLAPLAWQLKPSELGLVVINPEQSCDDDLDLDYMDSNYEETGVCAGEIMYCLIRCTGDARTCDLGHDSFGPGCVDRTAGGT
ncbi:Glycosyl hydrolase family 71 [Geosmithia morbida]|uniref:Glycosyl hydrolase family 71 n=1 Tax=Geosmithia morbida TaxID=1094350 RepID=A0A9P4YUZ0_9HYPO|nr:Glycosyl hydrolase family 71 [Geosmithia morbida]KAF4123593.1 Glycosyl hydrolase family 71 [Geosmithia morbida]